MSKIGMLFLQMEFHLNKLFSSFVFDGLARLCHSGGLSMNLNIPVCEFEK